MARGRAKQDTDTTGNPADTEPEFASVGGRSGDPARPARVRPVKRARIGVVILTVLLTELLIIAAGANQGVAKHLATYADDHRSTLLGNVLRSLLVLRWSVSASGHTDLWHAELITVGLVLLLGIVLVPMLVHGPVSWLRAFLGTWFAVVGGVCIAAVGGLVLSDLVESQDLTRYVVPGTPATGLSVSAKIDDAVFGGVLTYAFVAGVALGLVVALIVSTVTVASRRTDPVPVAVVPEPDQPTSPETPQPFFGNSVDDDRSARTTAYATRDDRSGQYGAGQYGAGQYGSDEYGTGGYGAARYSDSHPTESFPSGSRSADSQTYASPDRRAADNETTTIPAVTDRPPARSDADSTSELPRTEAVPAASSATAPPAAAPPAAAPSADTQAWPAQPAPEPASAPESAPASESAPESAPVPASEAESPSEPASAPEPAPDSVPASEPDAERTTAFPVPPDDEDLGHQPYHNED